MYYHIYNRGWNRGEIFLEDEDYTTLSGYWNGTSRQTLYKIAAAENTHIITKCYT